MRMEGIEGTVLTSFPNRSISSGRLDSWLRLSRSHRRLRMSVTLSTN